MNPQHGKTYAELGLKLPSIRGNEKPIQVRASNDVAFPYSLPLGRGPRQVDTGFTNYFEALNATQDRTPIPLYIFALRSILQTFNRVQLAFIARYLYDNDGLVSLAVDTIADYCTPVTPIAATGDTEVNKAHNEYFEDWKKRADFSGRFHFDTLERLISKSLDVDGDILPVMTDEHGFPQVQLLETWRIDSRAVQDRGVKHIDGVRVDEKQVTLGYYAVDSFNNFVIGLTPPKFISRNEAMLLYDPDRFSSYRGMSPLRRGGNDIRDAKDIKGFEKMATKISSALAAVIEGGGFEEEDVWGNDTGDPLDPPQDNPDGPMAGNKPPSKPTQQEQKLSVAELLGGDIITLPEGKKLNALNNNRPGERVIDMVTYLGGYMVSGLGLPPSFIIQGGHTGPGERSVNGKAQRKFDNRQLTIANFAEWAYVRVIGFGIANDGLPTAPRWDKPEWRGPSKVSIDDGRDAQQWRQDVQTGLMTRQSHFGNRSMNWQTETDQGFTEEDYILERASKQAEKYKVPIELILNRWGYSAARPAPTTTPGGEDQKPNQEKQ